MKVIVILVTFLNFAVVSSAVDLIKSLRTGTASAKTVAQDSMKRMFDFAQSAVLELQLRRLLLIIFRQSLTMRSRNERPLEIFC